MRVANILIYAAINGLRAGMAVAWYRAATSIYGQGRWFPHVGSSRTTGDRGKCLTINDRRADMKATFVKIGFNYLPAIKSSYSGNVKVLYGDVLATAATAKKYAQIEINRLNETRSGI